MGKIYERRLERPSPTISLGQAMLEKLRENGDDILIIDGHNGNQMTNKDLLEKSVKFANFLQKNGIKIGDRISIASENRMDYLVAICATFFIGAILAPYNPLYTEYEFQHLLNIAKPRIILVSRRTERLIAKIVPNLSWKITLIELDDQPFTADIRTLTDILNNEEVVDFLGYKVVDIGDTSQHPSIILCSSGTTGLPKEVALSHKSILAFMSKIKQPEYLNIRHRDRFLVFLPFFHGYAISLLQIGIYTNCIMVMMSSFEQKLFLDLIQKHKITHLPLVPPIMTFLAKYPLVEKYDFRSVRELMCGAAPLAKDIAAAMKARTGIKYIRNIYGMTELSIASNMSAREDEDDSFENLATGVCFPGFLSKIVDLETQETLDVGQVGEICFKGEQLMMGYWNNSEATRQTIDHDGWLHTGDVGYFDDKGNLRVVNRIKELIKYKGYQVSPSEIETVLLSHPAVKDAAVIGRPDERSGEIPMAFIVRQPDSTITVQDIQDFIKQKLSPQKWLRGGVQFIDAIPKNLSGKILRRELQSMIAKL